MFHVLSWKCLIYVKLKCLLLAAIRMFCLQKITRARFFCVTFLFCLFSYCQSPSKFWTLQVISLSHPKIFRLLNWSKIVCSLPSIRLWFISIDVCVNLIIHARHSNSIISLPREFYCITLLKTILSPQFHWLAGTHTHITQCYSTQMCIEQCTQKIFVLLQRCDAILSGNK
jgi:hypothetical protein